MKRNNLLPGFLAFLSLIFFLYWLPLEAQSGSGYYFEQGNKAYRANRYEKALEWYQKIVASGYQSAALYYNMGNCYFRLNRIGESVLYYQKALKLNPDDKEIRDNLDLARLKIIDRIEAPPRFFLFQWWENLLKFYTIPQWTRLTAFLYVLSMLIAILMILFKGHKFVSRIRFLLWTGGVLTLFSAYLLFVNVRREKSIKQGVVLVPAVTLTNAPEENSSAAFILHEGVTVQIIENRDEWVQISLPDGKSGWMKKADLGII